MDLRSGSARGCGRDSLRSFHVAVGSDHDDVLIGSRAANWLHGYAGDDVLRGLEGADGLFLDMTATTRSTAVSELTASSASAATT